MEHDAAAVKAKRKRWILAWVMGVLDALIIIALFVIVKGMFIGDPASPYVVTVGDLEIIPGETTGEDIANAGFLLYDDYNDTPYDTQLDSQDFESFSIKKDGEYYGSVFLRNLESDRAVTLRECYVTDVLVNKIYGHASYGGIAIEDLTKDILIDLVGQKPKQESSTFVKWSCGNMLLSYSLKFSWSSSGTDQCFLFSSVDYDTISLSSLAPNRDKDIRDIIR